TAGVPPTGGSTGRPRGRPTLGASCGAFCEPRGSCASLRVVAAVAAVAAAATAGSKRLDVGCHDVPPALEAFAGRVGDTLIVRVGVERVAIVGELCAIRAAVDRHGA